MNPNLETCIIFAARYAHNRPTGAAIIVVKMLKDAWRDLSPYGRKTILKEAEDAAYGREEWQLLRDFARDFKP